VATRVLIYGVTGSGKTTLARKVAARTGLPWHCVDDLTWEPGWVGVPVAEQRRRISAICAGERWILDHGYSSWLDLVLPRADLIVALDYPRWRSLGRLARRTLMRAVDRRPICNGNTETFRQMMSSDSILAWHFRSFDKVRVRLRDWAADPSGPQVIRLTSPARTRAWLAGLPGSN
jgi:adenylate kinase family enzyme